MVAVLTKASSHDALANRLNLELHDRV